MSLMKIKEALQIAKNKINEKGLEENAGLLLVEHLSGINNRTELFLKWMSPVLMNNYFIRNYKDI